MFIFQPTPFEGAPTRRRPARPRHPLKDDAVDVTDAAEGVQVDPDDAGSDSNEEGDADGVTPSLRETAAPLGPPVGADAAATRLSETICIKLPEEGESGGLELTLGLCGRRIIAHYIVVTFCSVVR